MADVKQIPLRLRDITLLDRIDAYAKREGLTRNEAILALVVYGLGSASAVKPYMGGLSRSRLDDQFARHGAGLVSSLDIQIGPVKRTGPLLKKAAK